MTIKLNLAFALAAVLAASPLLPGTAAEEKAKDAAAEEAASNEPTPAQLKARKQKKPSYTKFAEAKAVAERCNLPLFVAILPDGDASVAELKQKVINHKAFMKDFAQKNCVVAFMKVKSDSKDKKKIDTRGLKEPDLKFLENFAVSAHDIAEAKARNDDEPKYTDRRNFPVLICVDAQCQKELFRIKKYDKEGGFGVWLSQVVDSFRAANIEPVVSPLVTKIIENPDDPKKWK